MFYYPAPYPIYLFVTHAGYCYLSAVISRYFIALFISLLPFVAHAKDQHVIDSLKTVIEKADNDTTKAKALLRLSERLYFSNIDTAIQLSGQALQIYIKKNIENFE